MVNNQGQIPWNKGRTGVYSKEILNCSFVRIPDYLGDKK